VTLVARFLSTTISSVQDPARDALPFSFFMRACRLFRCRRAVCVLKAPAGWHVKVRRPEAGSACSGDAVNG